MVLDATTKILQVHPTPFIKDMPTRIQRAALKLWPVTVVVMIVVFPFLVRRSYRELVSGKQ